MKLDQLLREAWARQDKTEWISYFIFPNGFDIFTDYRCEFTALREDMEAKEFIWIGTIKDISSHPNIEEFINELNKKYRNKFV